jgi:hypothetical protein
MAETPFRSRSNDPGRPFELPKRPRYSRWRRLPEVFRTGEHKFPETSPETQRITLHLPVDVFETAETLAAKLEKPSVREYCAELLKQAIENERLLHHVEDFESRHGALEGLAEIAADPEYLTEWKAQSRGRDGAGSNHAEAPRAGLASPEHYVSFDAEHSPEPAPESEPLTPEILTETPPGAGPDGAGQEEAPAPSPSSISWPVETVVTSIRELPMNRSLEESPADVVRRHAGLGDEDHWSFLPCLRRGEPAPASMVDDLLEALARLNDEDRAATTLDRRLAHALHRLALESQVLLTEAWPGVFDERMVLAIRAVQEAVERNFAGQDELNRPVSSEGGGLTPPARQASESAH